MGNVLCCCFGEIITKCILCLFSLCSNCAKSIEGSCTCMQGKHTWYQLGITIFSVAQMAFQVIHLGNVQSALASFYDLIDQCDSQNQSAQDQQCISNAISSAQQLTKEQTTLTYMSVFYFVMLFLYLFLFECLKVHKRCQQTLSKSRRDRYFKCRQGFKSLLQIGLIILIIKVVLTTKNNEKLAQDLQQNSCFASKDQISVIFDSKIYTQAIINLVIFMIQICFDYNCLLFPQMRDITINRAQRGNNQRQQKMNDPNTRQDQGAQQGIIIQELSPFDTTQMFNKKYIY